jgi:hypothetical protein
VRVFVSRIVTLKESTLVQLLYVAPPRLYPHTLKPLKRVYVLHDGMPRAPHVYTVLAERKGSKQGGRQCLWDQNRPHCTSIHQLEKHPHPRPSVRMCHPSNQRFVTYQFALWCLAANQTGRTLGSMKYTYEWREYVADSGRAYYHNIITRM